MWNLGSSIVELDPYHMFERFVQPLSATKDVGEGKRWIKMVWLILKRLPSGLGFVLSFCPTNKAGYLIVLRRELGVGMCRDKIGIHR